jgi:MazG family protein
MLQWEFRSCPVTTTLMSSQAASPGEQFARLVEIMARLRSREGCPWDREQTFDTIKPYLLEETYEALDAIDQRDWGALKDELGDLLLEVVFFAQMAAEAGLFSVSDSLEAINAKLVRRHPHVFGDAVANTAGDVKKRWDEIKAEERKEKGVEHASMLATIARNSPALVEAQQIASKAAGAGFDWENAEQVIEKLHEELGELDQVRRQGNRQEELEDELGDMLFVVVNLARFLKVDPEQALRKSNAKFRKRFGYLEARLAEQGRTPQQSGMEEMEALWQEAKRAT